MKAPGQRGETERAGLVWSRPLLRGELIAAHLQGSNRDKGPPVLVGAGNLMKFSGHSLRFVSSH